MILTCNLKHNSDFSRELILAKNIADFAIKLKSNFKDDGNCRTNDALASGVCQSHFFW